MNRHQSNPFLANWEANDQVGNQIGGIFDIDATIQGDENPNLNSDCPETEIAPRRYSSSQADADENPFGAQRSNDRRLYHRNMSSFEAASLQLEHQQQMHENGATDQTSAETDLIAKMTADFRSAIETNDKQFSLGTETLSEVYNPVELNTFDPFETIVDDDISLPSPATSVNQQLQEVDKFPVMKHEDEACNENRNEDSSVNRPMHMNPDHQQTKNIHDSIDNDEDELVSTPVRNIKSSPQKAATHSSLESHHLAQDNVASIDEINFSSKFKECTDEGNQNTKDIENTNSITKASLFASLLASAESSQTVEDNVASMEGIDSFMNDLGQENSISHLANVENATHVIKGSHTTNDGSIDRSVGFFDPFETVIDKDALTSLMNDNKHYPTRPPTNEENFEPKTPDLTPTHKPYKEKEEEGENNGLQLNHDSSYRLSSLIATGSASIETVIDNASSYLNEDSSSTTFTHNVDLKPLEQKNNSNQDENLDYQPVPRPTKISHKIDQQAAPLVQEFPKITPAKKANNKQRKKSSFQEDSSESSDDDDRIQIVIKARDASKIESHTGSTFVPLLPPPPSKSSMKQARERGQVEDIPSPVMSYKMRQEQHKGSEQFETMKADNFEDLDRGEKINSYSHRDSKEDIRIAEKKYSHTKNNDVVDTNDIEEDENEQGGKFIISMIHSDDDGDTYGKPDTPLYDEDTSYVLEEFPAQYEGSGWEMMLRYPPKKKLTSNRFWKKIFVKLAQVPLVPDSKTSKHHQNMNESPQTCIALQIYDKPDDKKPMQEIPIQATYTVSEISSQQFDQFGKIFTIKLQYIFYKERVGVRQGQLARFIHSGHIGSSTTSGGHGVDPISIGAIKRMGAPIEHSPQISQIIKLGCISYSDIKQFKNCLEDYLFKMAIHRDRALSTYKTEEVQMAVRDETFIELNQVGTIIRQLARVRLFFLSFLNGTPIVEIGINDIHRQGREVVGRMDILPVVTEEWIRLEACELHSTVQGEEFENPDSRIIKLVPPDATFFELMRFRVRPPRNRELPLQISANMSVTRTKVSINCEVMVPGCVSRKHGQIPCEGIAIKVFIPECWIYFFREEKHFRMGSKKSVNRRPGKVKGFERFLGGGGLQDINNESSLIEVTSGQAKYEHHHHAIVWRAARWPKESQSAYVQNTMKIRLPLTAYDKMPENFYEYVHVEYTMPATTVSHTTLRSISVNPCDDEPPEKYVKYSAKYEYKVKMRHSVNFGSKLGETQAEVSPIIIMKQPDLQGDLKREEDSDDGSDDIEDDGISDQGEDH